MPPKYWTGHDVDAVVPGQAMALPASDEIKIRVTGLGGQGVILSNYLVGYAAIMKGYSALQIQTYGPSNRGSKVHSDLFIGPPGVEIKYPVIHRADILVAMAQLGYDAFYKQMQPHGVVLYDADLVTPNEEGLRLAKHHPVPGARIARELGNKMVANIVFLGALVNQLQLLTMEDLRAAIGVIVAKRHRPLNLDALERGSGYASRGDDGQDFGHPWG
jgi:2-oxoglutarate ferredoxin oxidoreductase subunit gamma